MKKPNIIWITCHDLGRFLGCYEADGAVTPQLDSLAGDGMLYRNAFCTSPLCSPSRASIHTGYYPHTNGMHGLAHEPFGWGMKEPARHFAHQVGKAGYAERILVGFEHLSLQPEELGYTDARFRLGPAREIGNEAATVIKEKAKGGPFYLEIGFFETHLPFDWGEVNPVDEPVNVPSYYEQSSSMKKAWRGLAAAVRALDEGVGMVLEAIRAAGIEEESWVIFTADHGLPFPRAKSTLYDAGLEAAFILRGPEGSFARGGKRSDKLVSLVDVVPTLAAEIPDYPQQKWQGVSVNSKSNREAIFSEKTYHTGYEPMRSVRTERHKLILNFATGPSYSLPSDIMGQDSTGSESLSAAAGQSSMMELYDLQADPWEMKNLAEDKNYSEIKGKLLRQLFDHLIATEDPILQGPIACPTHQRALSLFL